MKKIQCSILMICFLSFSILIQSCTLPGIMKDSSKFDNLSIDRHYEEGIHQLKWVEPGINLREVRMNWKLSLKSYRWGYNWHCKDNHFWLLDPQGNLFHIDVKTGNILFHYTSKSWKKILTMDNDKLFMLEEQNNGSYQIQAYQYKHKRILWTTSLESQKEPILDSHIVDGIMYTANSNNVVFAIRIQDGTELWRFHAEGELRSDLFLTGNMIFFTCKDSSCYAIDRFNGDILWNRQDLYVPITTSPSKIQLAVSTDEMIGYFGNHYEPFRAVKRDTGKILWEYPYSSADVFSYIVPSLKKDDHSSSTLDKPDWIISSFGKPFLAKNTLVLQIYANFQNIIHVIHPQSKKLIWKSEKVLFCYRTLDDNILIGRYAYEKNPDTFVIEKFEPETGELIWSYTALDDATNTENFEYSESTIIGQYLLLTDKTRNIVLLNLQKGKAVWGYSSPIYSGFKNLSVCNNLFFVEQPETNSIYCFSTNN